MDIHCNNEREITAIDIKLRSFNSTLSGHQLTATISAAFFKTTLLTDAGGVLNISLNAQRSDVVDITIDLRESKKEIHLTFEDIAHFMSAFQEALDSTHLGF